MRCSPSSREQGPEGREPGRQGAEGPKGWSFPQAGRVGKGDPGERDGRGRCGRHLDSDPALPPASWEVPTRDCLSLASVADTENGGEDGDGRLSGFSPLTWLLHPDPEFRMEELGGLWARPRFWTL